MGKETAMGDPLSDCSPLISAAASCKLRLVRLLVEGGAQVNRQNPKGETPLLAACKALRGEPGGPETVKLLSYLLQNKAEPNTQDRAGRTALMYACMERAGAQVASTLLAAGADPSMEDHSGASALVYAVNAQHQPTLKVLMDACRARGRDIIIITTQVNVNGGPVTRRFLNVTPSPDSSPVSCMSPSDIILKTGSPNSPEGENIFNFRGTGGTRGSSSSSSSSGSGSGRPPSCELGQSSNPPPRQRMLSEPWLAIHNLACLNRAYEEGLMERSLRGEGGREDSRWETGERGGEEPHFHQSRGEERKEGLLQRRDYRCGGENYNSEVFLPRLSQSALSLTEVSSSQATASRLFPKRCLMPGGSTSDNTTLKSGVDKLPACLPPHCQLRRNTLPSVMVVPPPLQLPPLVHQSDSHLQVPIPQSRSMVFLPHPPSSSSPRARVRLPRLLPSSSCSSLAAPPASSSLAAPRASCCSKRSLRRHSVQLDQIRGGETI
ncbi:ankyrin repeat domain-containing protein 34C [Pseudochaenichthys georgianus]|uniref:ankyrin repeat domain-containing protein 34C n=1 Tax=Pseudochaenichthys georgianus TaxID=52239 RepID=UPI0039C40A74